MPETMQEPRTAQEGWQEGPWKAAWASWAPGQWQQWGQWQPWSQGQKW